MWHVDHDMGWWMLWGGCSSLHSPIAKERYARGDITREEFEQIKRNLAGS